MASEATAAVAQGARAAAWAEARAAAARAAAREVVAKAAAVAESAVAQGAARCRHRSSRSSPRSHIRYSLGRGPSGILGSTLGPSAAGGRVSSMAAKVVSAVMSAVVLGCNQGGTVGTPVCERTVDRRSRCMARSIDRAATRCAWQRPMSVVVTAPALGGRARGQTKISGKTRSRTESAGAPADQVLPAQRDEELPRHEAHPRVWLVARRRVVHLC
jgi:hypothetical protein